MNRMSAAARSVGLVILAVALWTALAAGAGQRTQSTAKGTLVSVDAQQLSIVVKLEGGGEETFWLGQGDPYTFNGKYLPLAKFQKGDAVALKYYVVPQNDRKFDTSVEKLGAAPVAKKPAPKKK